MQLSTSTNIYFNRPDGSKASITDSIRLCASAGYEAMDMNFHDCTMFPTEFQTHNWERWITDIQETARQCGITFNQAHAPFYNFCDLDAPDQERLDQLIDRSILCSQLLGVKWLVIHAGTDFNSTTPLRDSRRKNIDRLSPIIERAGEYGVGIAIENLWDLNIAPMKRYTSTAEELMDLLDGLPYDNVGVCWDVEHADLMKQDQHAALQLIGERLKATHISDYTSMSNDHILPFQGRMDWSATMHALAACGYKGDFAFEIHRYTERLPQELVPGALRHSVDVGRYLLSLCH